MALFRRIGGDKKAAESASGGAVKLDGVYYTFNKTTKTLLVDCADQELEVMSLPSRIAEACESALVVDVSGNNFVSLESFEHFESCETLFLDGNQLREECIVLSGGNVLRRVHTLYLNKNRIRDARLLAINIANTFPSVRHVSVLWNPCAPVNEGPEYERMRRLLIYKLPSLKSIDARMVTAEEKVQAEKENTMTAAQQQKAKNDEAKKGKKEEKKEKKRRGSKATSSDSDEGKGKEEAEVAEKEEKQELRRDSEQARLVRAAKRDMLAKNRSVSTSSIRQSAGLAVTSASGLVKAGPHGQSDDHSNDDGDDDDDDSYLMGQTDDSSEAGGRDEMSENQQERRSTNYPIVRSVSLSGRKLQDHFEYAKPQPAGKLVDREGWLTLRLKKTRWKRCWFVLKGGALFRYRTPEDDLYVEQIIISGARVGKSENRKGNCFKVEKGGEKLVFMAEDSWDQATWIIQLEKWTGTASAAPPSNAVALAAAGGGKKSIESSDSEQGVKKKRLSGVFSKKNK